MWNKFLTSNTAGMRVTRTVFQGIIGVIITNLDVIIGLQTWIPDAYKAICVALIMAILSPVMAEIGRHTNDADEDLSFKVEEGIGAPIPDIEDIDESEDEFAEDEFVEE